MKWNEVKTIYPNQFVKFEILESRVAEDKEYIDDVAVIGPISDEEATKELLNTKNNILVYHTSKDEIILKRRTRIGLRRAPYNEN